MTSSFSNAYLAPSFLKSIRLLIAALKAHGGAKRLASMNRYRDYLAVMNDPTLFGLHGQINDILQAANETWQSHDYGAGYLYQGFAAVKLTGLRDTDARVERMQLTDRVRGRSVLEIGCNSGFIALLLASHAKHVDAFDVNPHLVEIGKTVGAHLHAGNVAFSVAAFEDLPLGEPYDVVLSFANHSTYDGNTSQGIEEYFARCHRFTADDGLLIFESHAPDYEGDKLAPTLALLEKYFETTERRTLEYGTFMDTGRTFVVARKRP